MSFILLNDYRVCGYGIKTSLSFKTKDEDASGETSSTAKASKGTKGKKLSVDLQLRYKDEKDLRELVRIAEGKEGGDSIKYTLTNPTANCVGMMQCTFTGDFKIEQDDTLHKWNISFTLSEFISVPEKAEGKQKAKGAEAPTSTGEAITPPAADGASGADGAEKQEEKLSDFEKKLQWVSDKIGEPDEA